MLISISFKGLVREGEKSLVSHKHLIIQMKKTAVGTRGLQEAISPWVAEASLRRAVCAAGVLTTSEPNISLTFSGLWADGGSLMT